LVISLVASLTLGFGDLRRGFILQWGTVLFFAFCVLFVDLLKVFWVAEQMDLLSNATLTAIIWLTILMGRPFALQYARRDLPKELWNDEKLVQGCRFITLVWACLMTLATGISVFRRLSVVHLPDWVYFDISLCIIFFGLTYTTLFKRRKRLQREKAGTEA
jgi:carotenoid cleavage dioxygenase